MLHLSFTAFEKTTHCLIVVVFMLLAFCHNVNALQSIEVLGLFKDKAVVIIDGKRRVLSANKASPEGVILVAADSDKAVLEFDGNRKSYFLGRRISTSFRAPVAKASVQIFPDTSGMYLTNGSINGFQTKFLVDTGATTIAMNRNVARRIGLNYKMDGAEGSASTASGITKAYYLTLNKVKIGELLINDVEAAVIDSDFPQEVLLGNSFLNKTKMIRNGRVLQLQMK